MAELTVITALTRYFNVDDGKGVKRPVSAWNAELKQFTTEEKRELAGAVCAVTGDTLKS